MPRSLLPKPSRLSEGARFRVLAPGLTGGSSPCGVYLTIEDARRVQAHYPGAIIDRVDRDGIKVEAVK